MKFNTSIKWRHRAAALLVLSLMLLGIAPALRTSAASPSELEIESVRGVKFWSGAVTRSGPSTDKNPVCQTGHRDHVRVEVELPRDTWKRSDLSGLEFAIRWNGEISFNDNLCLSVYRGGKLVAERDALVASAQSVIIPSAPNGNYDVYISYNGQSDNDRIPYDGLTQVQTKPTKPGNLLPDLVARGQRNVTFDRPTFDLFEPPALPGHSCFQSEEQEHGAKVCLRFDQVLANVGDGALDLRFSRPTGVTQDEAVSQRIYKADGTFTDKPAGEVEWHDTHHHYHFKGFAQSTLWKVDSAGNRTGTAPIATGDKVSFCIADTDYDHWGGKGVAAMFYIAPNCLDPYQTAGGREYFKQGMGAGWGDVYNWFLPDQYIEASKVPNGTYALQTIVDPDNRLVESNDHNNCKTVLVKLTNMGTSTPHAELLNQQGPACSC